MWFILSWRKHPKYVRWITTEVSGSFQNTEGSKAEYSDVGIHCRLLKPSGTNPNLSVFNSTLMYLPQNSKVKHLAYRIREYLEQHMWVQSGCERSCLSRSHVLPSCESHIMVHGFVSLKAISALLWFLGYFPLAIPQIYPWSSYFTPTPHHPLSQPPRTPLPHTQDVHLLSPSGLMQSPTASCSPCPTRAPIACLPHRTRGLLWPRSPSTLSHRAACFPCGP